MQTIGNACFFTLLYCGMKMIDNTIKDLFLSRRVKCEVKIVQTSEDDKLTVRLGAAEPLGRV